MRLVSLSGVSILQQLQWEEALLRADENNWCILNHSPPPAIVMGISAVAEQVIDLEHWEENPIPLVRRFSGGGTVVVDENTLFITLICRGESTPRSVMRWTAEALYAPLFDDLPFSLHENDYALSDKKWGGNAQAFVRGRWLHHTSALWSYSPKMMRYLRMPPRAPAYRQGRSHDDFLCSLHPYWETKEHFLTAFQQQLGLHFPLELCSEEELATIAERPHRRTVEASIKPFYQML